MPGTSRKDKPVYRASKSWDYVSSDSIASSDNQASNHEDTDTKHAHEAVDTSYSGQNHQEPSSLNSLENIMAEFSEEPHDIEGVEEGDTRKE